MSSNRFLNGSDGGLTLSDLQDGSLSLYINRLKTQGMLKQMIMKVSDTLV